MDQASCHVTGRYQRSIISGWGIVRFRPVERAESSPAMQLGCKIVRDGGEVSKPTRHVTPIPENLSAPAAPGIYPTGRASQLGFWDGSAWDPRPVASTWTRVWCNAIDFFIASVIWLLVAFIVVVAVAFFIPAPTADGGSDSSSRLVTLTTLAVAFLGYFTVSYRLWGRTPGMMLGKLHVVRIPSGGAPMSWSDSFLRALVLCFGYSCGILTLVWLTITASSRTKQGPHDSAAHTVVLAGQGPRPVPPSPVPTPPARADLDPMAAMPSSNAAPAAQPPLAQAQVVPPPDGSKRLRGSMVVGVAAGCVALLMVLIGVGAFVDSRIRVNEMNQLLAVTQASEQVQRNFESDPELEVIVEKISVLNSLSTLPPEVRVEAQNRLLRSLADVAQRHVGPMQVAVLNVEEVSVLPWHSDIAAARDAYTEHADTWLQLISGLSAQALDGTQLAQLEAELLPTWVMVQRRFENVRILWIPEDVPERIQALFADQ